MAGQSTWLGNLRALRHAQVIDNISKHLQCQEALQNHPVISIDSRTGSVMFFLIGKNLQISVATVSIIRFIFLIDALLSHL